MAVSPRRVGALLLALAPLLLAALVAAADAARGGPLAGFAAEYAHGGACKLRTDGAFHALVWLGLLGFPLGLAALVEALAAWGTARAAALVRGGLALAGLLWLAALGLVRPALGLCP